MNLSQLPIFPLPGVVLLPGSIVPLHVFEPRYRQLVADCRAGDGAMGLATLAGTDGQSEPPVVHPVLGAGIIAGYTPLDDGRCVIAVQGVVRARIVDERPSGLPYRVVSAEPIEDAPSSSPGAVRELATLRALTDRLARADRDDQTGAKELAAWTAKQADVGRLADVVGGALVDDRDDRIALLEQRDPVDRLALVNRRVAQLLAALGGQDQRPARAN